jgi:drug/metabolite transporter (DMT)-like permease
MRYATHLTVVILCCGWRYRGALVKTKKPWVQFFRSSLMFGMPLCFLSALARMKRNTALTVFWVAPIILLAGDRKSAAAPSNWIAILSAYGGAVLLLWPGGPVAIRALVFPAGMALCFSAYLIVTRRLQKELEVTNLFYTAFWVFLEMTLALPRVWQTPSARGVLVGVAIGIAGLGALNAVDRAVRRTSPGAIGTAFYLQPVFTTLIEWLTLHTQPSLRTVAGLLLVCASIAAQATFAAVSGGGEAAA